MLFRLFILLLPGVVFSQKPIARMLGHGDLSKEGQDTIVKYYRTNYDELWGRATLDVPDTQNKLNSKFQHFFQGKLSESDLKAVEKSWLNPALPAGYGDVNEYAMKARASEMCQEAAFEALLDQYLPRLKAASTCILENITDQELALLHDDLTVSITGLEKKKKEFLLFEYRKTYHKTSDIYNYLIAAFERTKAIPDAHYYELITHERIHTPKNLSCQTYLDLYSEFSSAVLEIRQRDSCRWYPMVPPYRKEVFELPGILEKNAILFAGIHFLEFENLPPVDLTSSLFVGIDSVNFEDLKWDESDDASLGLNKDLLANAGFQELPGMDDGTLFYASMNEGSVKEMISIKPLEAGLDNFRAQIEGNESCLSGWRKIPDLLEAVYLCDLNTYDPFAESRMTVNLVVPSARGTYLVTVNGEVTEDLVYSVTEFFGIRKQ